MAGVFHSILSAAKIALVYVMDVVSITVKKAIEIFPGAVQVVQKFATKAADAVIGFVQAHRLAFKVTAAVALAVVAGIVILKIVVPMILMILHCIGFTVLGPAAGASHMFKLYHELASLTATLLSTGSLAAFVQATFYGARVASGSIFSVLQSFAMRMG